MFTPLILAIITITLALVFYTWGVFSERHAGRLTRRNLILFWIGLAFDITGTSIMSGMARNTAAVSSATLSWHGITGAIAILLMLFHAIWATWVLVKGSEKQQRSFHKFSIVVWAIWLIPYVLGMVMGMQG